MAVQYNNIDLPEIEKHVDNEGIGFLVNMAKAGKIDPWNINIVDITDKYLAHLCEMKSQNLRLTGRALLFASVLLNMKSRVLDGVDVLQFQDEPENNLEFDDDGKIKLRKNREDFLSQEKEEEDQDGNRVGPCAPHNRYPLCHVYPVSGGQGKGG